MKNQIIADIRVIPIGTETPSVSHYVAGCLDIITQTENISYELTAMGTIVQGSLETVLALTKKLHESPFNMGAQRGVTISNIDDRRDKQITIEGKVQAVKQKSRW